MSKRTHLVALVASLTLAVALVTDGRCGSAPVLPTFAQVHERMVALFANTPSAWTDIETKSGPKSVDLFPKGRDQQAWALLVEGVSNSKPGLAIPSPATIVLQCGRDMGDGSFENRPVFYKDGMLGCTDPYLGSAVRTLEVGPEFERGLRLLERNAKIKLKWSAPPPDESKAEARAARVSRDRAVNIARRFAERAGVPLGQRPHAVFRVAKWPLGPRWEVRLGDLVSVSIEANSGSVIEVANRSAGAESSELGRKATLSEAAARERAEKMLDLMGVPRRELAFEKARSSGGDGTGESWSVTWVRVRDAIPYNEDGFHVALDGASGAVIYAAKAFWNGPPASLRTRISKAQVTGILAGLADRVQPGGKLHAVGEPMLLIVQPNHYYPDPRKSLRSRYQGGTRVAWEVRVEAGGGAGHQHEYRIWIDAATGELLGGYGCL